MFCENFENIQQKSEEKIIIFFLKQFLSWKLSFGHVEWSFDKQARYYCQKSENFLPCVWECKCLNFFPEESFSKKFLLGTCSSLLKIMSKNFRKRPGKLQTGLQKWISIFSKGSFFLDKFPLPRREQSWQPSRNFHIKSPHKFRRFS